MAAKKSDNTLATDFTRQLLQDSALLPLPLLRSYRELGLSERDALILLRIVAHCFQQSAMTLAQLGQEFEVSEEEARAIAQPYVAKKWLEYDGARQSYSCQGLLHIMYISWAGNQRPGNGIAAVSDTARAQRQQETKEREKQLIRDIARMYHLFEQELGRNLRYSECQTLRAWLDEDNIHPELIEEALHRAILQDKCTLSYIGAILRSWQKQKLTTLDQVTAHDVKPAATGKNSGPAAAVPTKSGKFDDIDELMIK